jgi:hypothetical protein
VHIVARRATIEEELRSSLEASFVEEASLVVEAFSFEEGSLEAWAGQPFEDA